MALIDRFLPVLGFAALLRADPGLADASYEDVRRDMEELIRQGLDEELQPFAPRAAAASPAFDNAAFHALRHAAGNTAGSAPGNAYGDISGNGRRISASDAAGTSDNMRGAPPNDLSGLPPDAAAGGVLNDALFAACAFADEMLLTSRWSGRFQWAKETLQQTRFRSADAGEVFFGRLEALTGRLNAWRGAVSLNEPPVLRGSSASAELAAGAVGTGTVGAGEELTRQALEVYAACLALGYTGRYYRPEERQTLDGLTRAGRDAVLDGAARPERLFPEIYSDPPRKKTPVLGYLGRMAVLWGGPALITLLLYGLYNLLLADRLSAVEALFR